MKYFFGIILLITASTGISQRLSVTKICDLETKLYETSGLAIIENKYLVTHNDGGNKSEIYILNLKGELLKTIDVDEAKNYDWEDLALDEKGKLYIGDFGNNLNKREKCHIYILKKDFVHDKNLKVNAEKITFTYEDQKQFPPKKENLNFDAESFIWMNDSLYIFTKCRSKPFTGISNIYVIPAKPGKYKAKKIGSLQFCSANWQWCSVTAADYNPKLKELTVLTYSKMHVFSSFEGHEFWKGKRKSFNLPVIKQREAICYKGKNTWFMTDEYRRGLGGGNLYLLKVK
jgi:hypothetical protein